MKVTTSHPFIVLAEACVHIQTHQLNFSHLTCFHPAEEEQQEEGEEEEGDDDTTKKEKMTSGKSARSRKYVV